jgi:hypothetical protein
VEIINGCDSFDSSESQLMISRREEPSFMPDQSASDVDIGD